MGRGTELIFVGIFLYRAISRFGVIHAVEQPLYAALGWFMWLRNLWFAWMLVTSAEFRAVFVEGKEDIDIEKCRQEIVSVAKKLVLSAPEIGAIVLECTNMPPFAEDIQNSIGLPVFDVVTMINYVYSSINQRLFA